MKKGIYKVPNGKLLKIHVDEKDGVISSVKIMGDFFMHPEETIEDLERALVGIPLKKGALISQIENFLQKNRIELFGVDAESIAITIINAS